MIFDQSNTRQDKSILYNIISYYIYVNIIKAHRAHEDKFIRYDKNTFIVILGVQ